MSQNNNLVEALGVDPSRMQEFRDAIVYNSFFSKLADYGIVPASEQHAAQLCEMADRLSQHEQKTAAAATNDRIGNAYNIMAGIGAKHAQSPQGRQQVFAADVADKTASFLSDPEMFAYALGARSLEVQAAQAQAV